MKPTLQIETFGDNELVKIAEYYRKAKNYIVDIRQKDSMTIFITTLGK